MTLLRKSLLEAASGACDEKVVWTAAQFKELLKLGLVAARQTQRINRTTVSEIWQPQSWHSLSGQLAASPRFKKSPGLQKMCEQIVRLSGADAVSKSGKEEGVSAATKRKADAIVETEESVVVAKKTKRKKVKTDKS